MDKPLISVIVPVYNVEKYIHKCVDSILLQDYPLFEMIIVDDGSTDKSGVIADEYASQYSDIITVIHQKNAGLGGARNTGIHSAKGEYIAFIDSDDTISREYLSTLYNVIENTGAEISVCNIVSILPNGELGEVYGANNMQLNVLVSAKDNEEVFTVTPSACNKLFKRSLFLENNILFPPKVWYEDLRTIYKLFPVANGIAFTDEQLYNYFVREGSIMHNPNIERNREIIDALNDLISFYKSKNIYDDYYDVLEFLTIQHVFWETSVRILKTTSHHKSLGELREFTFTTFPKAFKNNKFKEFVNRKGIKGKVICCCLRFKLYSLLHLMLKN